ncbi:WD repeat protein [Cryptosporidium canis]|uniref:WD repeat protein n=1 Tax=Cryptosporidium canis TaxID=195482 RepID=A0A9D5DLD0_9CRYT|nr:WD repeat protein [Cryptosporidium canis]
MRESLKERPGYEAGSREEVLVVGGPHSWEEAEGGSSSPLPALEEAEDKGKGIMGVLSTVFAFKAHLTSIKDLDSRGSLLVTASTDETMRIYNLKTRCDSGMLTKHQGSVTCVRLSWNSRYLISCGEDKAVYIWRCVNWDPVKSFEGVHEATPISADFHPSMKLALTLDIDGNLCLLDLLKGALALRFAVPGVGKKGLSFNRRFGLFTSVRFSLSGTYYAVLSQREVVIARLTDEGWSIGSSSTELGLGAAQITSFCWVSDEAFLVGFSNGELRALRITREALRSIEVSFSMSGQSQSGAENPHLGSRIKGICTVGHAHTGERGGASCSIRGRLVTCDSTGVFALFNLTLDPSHAAGSGRLMLEIVDVLDSDNRITCMVVEDKSPVDPLSLSGLEDPDPPARDNKRPKVIKKGKSVGRTERNSSKQ